MAIELRKSWGMSPEEYYRIYGINVSPNNKYRVLGTPASDPITAYRSLLNSGQVTGSSQFGSEAYFSHGAIHGQYYGDYGATGAMSGDLNRNFVYEMTPEFATKGNGLYERTGTTHNGIKLDFENPAYGEYGTVSPKENPRFIDRINQRGNNYGLRGGEFISGRFDGPKKGFETGTPKIEWKFDYTKPFFKTSVPNHLMNAEHTVRTVLAQPETKAVLNNLGTKAATGLAIAYAPYDALNRREANFTDFYNRYRRDPTYEENMGLRIQSGLEPALNMATLGLYDALAETPTYKAYLDQEYRDLGRRKVVQSGIDYPIIGGYQVERTTR